MTDIAYASPDTPLSQGGILTQTWALLVDAYRDLNARKLFWITLILSVLVSGAFFLVGIDAKGISIAWWSFPSPVNSQTLPPDQFFKFLFASFAVPLWLGFFAAILALISVASIFPDLLSGGAIDLYLSKPISRLRLFVTKYVFGLLFAALQVTAFTFVSFMVIGIRGGVWDPKVFLAVPIVTLFFSYLYCVCTLIGVMTRSTLAAILVTVLLWGVLFLVNLTDGVMLNFKHATAVQVETQDRVIGRSKQIIDYNNSLPVAERADYSKSFDLGIAKQIEARKDFVASHESVARWQHGVFLAKSLLPKTGETVSLLDRTLIDDQTRRNLRNDDRDQQNDDRRIDQRTGNAGVVMEDSIVQQRTAAEIRGRSAWWVTGTSLGFEVVVLALAAWVFCRRDY